jgi:SSS family solute:Na+ symporter
MQLIDWILVVLPLVLMISIALYTRRFVRSVADFLAGGRCAGRYLLANARGESDAGLANTMSKFEIIMVSGFVLNFWEKVSIPVLLLVGISGFVIYRYRETRAMTLAQFFEMRYSRRFRLFMGLLAFISGILNYGIFPAVSARFFIYFLDLPLHVHVLGMAWSTFALIMICYLSCTLIMVLIGGQVTAMVTDCIEGILSHLVYIIIVVALLTIVHWSQIVQVMSGSPVNKSLINPFDARDVEDFNVWYAAMALLISIYTTMASQNKQGFNAAARTPHESRMGGVLGYWRGYARGLMLLVLGVCAVTFIRHPDFAPQATAVHAAIGSIHDVYLQKQMTVPIALRYLLPAGIKGLFVSIMIMGLIAGDAGHMHSWGSIFVQDVVLPLRKKPMSPREHMFVLRLAVLGVAVFALFFSLFFPQTSFIALWWAITMGIFTGGAGAAIIGGLYWKRGSTAGAWAGALTGSILSFAGIVCSSKRWADVVRPGLAHVGVALPEKFWLNNQESAFLAAIVAATTYIVVSLLTSRRAFNLDRMLHRGAYADATNVLPRTGVQARNWLHRVLRFDANFTFADKLVAGGIFWWSMLLLSINLVVSAWNLAFYPWPTSWWAHYWLVMGIGLPFLIAVGTLFWFGIGGILDIRSFFAALRLLKPNPADDGRVNTPAPEPAVAEEMAADTSKSVAARK